MKPQLSKIRWLMLPTEIAARELDSKLLLACAAAVRGFGVVVGSIRGIYGALPGLPRGLWVTGCIDRSKVSELQALRQQRYRVVCCDEEGFMQFDDSHYVRNRVSAEGFAEIEVMLAASPDHERILAGAFPDMCHQVVQTGNPRTDLLRQCLRGIYSAGAEALRQRYGRFILVNGNFSENALVGQEMLRHMRTITGGIVDDKDRAWYAARHEYETAILDEFRKMLLYLGREMPDVPIILRPHPQEDFARWREMLKDFPNLSVVYEGNVHKWAIAASAVIHNSCTTGVESHLLGRPVIAYRPIRSDVYDLWLPNAVSEEICELPTLQRRLREAIAAPEGDGRSEFREREALEYHFGPLEGPFAFERIVAAMEKLDVEPEGWPRSSTPSPFLMGDLRETARLFAQRWPRASRNLFGETHLNYWLFDQQKFPSLPLASVETRVRQFGELLPSLAGVQVRQLGRDIFHLFRASPTRH